MENFNIAARARVARALLLVRLQACAASHLRSLLSRVPSRSRVGRCSVALWFGYPSTPPPGQYRFVRVYDNGRVESREVHAVNRTGPWLTYEGEAQILTGVDARFFARLTARLHRRRRATVERRAYSEPFPLRASHGVAARIGVGCSCARHRSVSRTAEH